jgi:heme-degrading monooxygenase HmoA
MILEIATICIHPGQQAAFESAVSQAVPLFLRAKGCLSVQLLGCIEEPSAYRLHVQWETVENHTVDFRSSSDFQLWRDLVGHFFATPPQVIHARAVLDAA